MLASRDSLKLFRILGDGYTLNEAKTCINAGMKIGANVEGVYVHGGVKAGSCAGMLKEIGDDKVKKTFVEDFVALVKGGASEYITRMAYKQLPTADLMQEWGEAVQYNPEIIDSKTERLFQLVTGTDFANGNLIRRNMQQALEEYLAESSSCRCSQCRNNGVAVLKDLSVLYYTLQCIYYGKLLIELYRLNEYVHAAVPLTQEEVKDFKTLQARFQNNSDFPKNNLWSRPPLAVKPKAVNLPKKRVPPLPVKNTGEGLSRRTVSDEVNETAGPGRKHALPVQSSTLPSTKPLPDKTVLKCTGADTFKAGVVREEGKDEQSAADAFKHTRRLWENTLSQHMKRPDLAKLNHGGVVKPFSRPHSTVWEAAGNGSLSPTVANVEKAYCQTRDFPPAKDLSKCPPPLPRKDLMEGRSCPVKEQPDISKCPPPLPCKDHMDGQTDISKCPPPLPRKDVMEEHPCPVKEQPDISKCPPPLPCKDHMEGQTDISKCPPPLPRKDYMEGRPCPVKEQPDISKCPPTLPHKDYMEGHPCPVKEQTDISKCPPPLPRKDVMEEHPCPVKEQTDISKCPPPLPRKDHMEGHPCPVKEQADSPWKALAVSLPADTKPADPDLGTDGLY
ncbi:UNVERIFIED_CONTAM: hypothetical protein FKN15_071582 [Acipenser sinensis]